MIQRHLTKHWAVAVCMLALTGCSALVPQVETLDAKAPTLPASFDAAPSAQAPGLRADDPLWWRRFADPSLEVVVAEALAHNTEILLTQAGVQASSAELVLRGSDRRPVVSVGGSASQRRSSLDDPSRAGLSSQPGYQRNTTTWTTNASAAWDADLFGGLTAAERAAEQRLRSAQALAAQTHAAVAADAATLLVNIRTLEKRIVLADEAVAIESELSEVTQAKRRGGVVSEADVLRLRAQVDAIVATRAQLRSELEAQVLSLTILLGSTPAQVKATLAARAAKLPVPPDVAAVGLPSELLRRRPDVLSAQADLRAASEDLAATAAQQYPSLRLTSSLGWIAATAGSLGSGAALFATIAPALDWTVIDFGAARARVDQRRAVERQAWLRYQQAVFTAFAQADTAVRQLGLKRIEASASARAVASQREAWTLLRLQYEHGLVDLTTALEARRTLNSDQAALVLAEQGLVNAALNLYRAFGGGWDASSVPSEDAVPAKAALATSALRLSGGDRAAGNGSSPPTSARAVTFDH
jgi:outer membrane protein, multidrug efflux system